MAKHASRVTDRRMDGQTDRQNYDCQDRANIAASRGKQKSVNKAFVDPGTRGSRDKWDDTEIFRSISKNAPEVGFKRNAAHQFTFDHNEAPAYCRFK